MSTTNVFHIVVVGMAIFSMFFGGGNLTFPLWIGSETESITMASFGFILTGVLLPFYGIIVSLYFQGNYENYLNACGKLLGALLVFALLLFWIPFGSGPRCNQLAYGTFCSQFGEAIPLWLYSAFYSFLVYALTFRETRVIEILGKVLTPLLIIALFLLIIAVFSFPISHEPIVKNQSGWSSLYASFFTGYQTMDFIAAIFFSSTVVSLIKEKQKDQFDLAFVKKACFFAITLLSLIYVGLIFVGHTNAEFLSNVPKDRLLAEIGRRLFSEKFQIIIFMIINLSVLSTSMALSLVFSDYLRKTLFKNKIGHQSCLFISVLISYVISIIGFDQLAVLISYATSMLYPILLFITTYAFIRSFMRKRCAYRHFKNSQAFAKQVHL